MHLRHSYPSIVLTLCLVSVQSIWWLLLEYTYFQAWHGYALSVLLLCLGIAQLYYLRPITNPGVWGILLFMSLVIMSLILVKPRVVCTIMPGLHSARVTAAQDYWITSPEYWSTSDNCAGLRHPQASIYGKY
jgi:hypothetical protein